MRILAIPGRNDAVEYVRMVLPLSVLARSEPGWSVDIVPQASLYRLMDSPKVYDMIVLGATCAYASPEDAGRSIRELGQMVPVVYDGDDNYFVDNPNPERTLSEWDMEIVRAGMRAATAVTTTTGHLADVYREINPRVYVLPNCVSSKVWNSKYRAERAIPGLRIGWFGGDSHAGDLKLVEEALVEVASRYEQVMVVIAGYITDSLAARLKERLRYFQWIDSVERVPLVVSQMDIGLCPLADGEFNRCRSGLKWYEYSAMGIPVVASPVGPYKEINPFVNGLVARDTDEWIRNISLLVSNRDIRQSLGRAARQYVLSRYDVARWYVRWQRAYQEIRAGR